MSHATPFTSFISPVPSTGEAEAVLLPRLIVSAINSRFSTVYMRMSAFIQYALCNLSNSLQASPTSIVPRKVKRNGEALQCPTKVLKDLTK